MKRTLEQYKVSLQTRAGMQYTRFYFASDSSVAFDQLLQDTGTKTDQIDRNPDGSRMMWITGTGVKATVDARPALVGGVVEK